MMCVMCVMMAPLRECLGIPMLLIAASTGISSAAVSQPAQADSTKIFSPRSASFKARSHRPQRSIKSGLQRRATVEARQGRRRREARRSRSCCTGRADIGSAVVMNEFRKVRSASVMQCVELVVDVLACFKFTSSASACAASI
ncbi:hypothetical protein DFJ77DRAFT_456769 [Powellomyces hirtus]|nr:hypothetical protein DFJ77DRAFT_456769 [Powellomyces hirtus]